MDDNLVYMYPIQWIQKISIPYTSFQWIKITCTYKPISKVFFQLYNMFRTKEYLKETLVQLNNTHSPVFIISTVSNNMLKRTLFILQQLAKEGQEHYLHNCAKERDKKTCVDKSIIVYHSFREIIPSMKILYW